MSKRSSAEKNMPPRRAEQPPTIAEQMVMHALSAEQYAQMHRPGWRRIYAYETDAPDRRSLVQRLLNRAAGDLSGFRPDDPEGFRLDETGSAYHAAADLITAINDCSTRPGPPTKDMAAIMRAATKRLVGLNQGTGRDMPWVPRKRLARDTRAHFVANLTRLMDDGGPEAKKPAAIAAWLAGQTMNADGARLLKVKSGASVPLALWQKAISNALCTATEDGRRKRAVNQSERLADAAVSAVLNLQTGKRLDLRPRSDRR